MIIKLLSIIHYGFLTKEFGDGGGEKTLAFICTQVKAKDMERFPTIFIK